MKHAALTLIQKLLIGDEIVLEGRRYTLERTEEGNFAVICTPMIKIKPDKSEETFNLQTSIPLSYLINQAERMTEAEVFIMNAEIALKDINTRKFKNQKL